MKQNNIVKACAMGLDKFENYDHLKFIEKCNKFKNLKKRWPARPPDFFSFC